MGPKGKKLLQKYRVPLGFVSAAIFFIFARPSIFLLLIGGAIAAVGLMIRAWGSGHLRKNEEVTVSGPYAFTRNPLYLGSFLLGLGFTVAAGVWWLALVFAALFLGIYFPVMGVEADELTKRFGDEYKQYAKRVSLFLPWYSGYRPSEKKFELELYLRYREYRALLGAVFAWTVLALKAYFLDSL